MSCLRTAAVSQSVVFLSNLIIYSHFTVTPLALQNPLTVLNCVYLAFPQPLICKALASLNAETNLTNPDGLSNSQKHRTQK